MTITARAEARTVDWKVWVPGVVMPIACFAVDYIIGEPVLQYAPAALLALAAVGLASLVVSRNWRQTAAGLAAVGPLWVVGGLTFGLGIVLAAVSGWALLFFLLVLCCSAPSIVPPAAIIGWAVCALLGLTPLWTGLTFLGEALASSAVHTARHGTRKTARFGFSGAAAAISIVIAAHAADSRFVNARVAAVDRQAPATWEADLRSLNAYPLCMRERCRRLVCRHLFGRTPPGAIIEACIGMTGLGFD
jgi:hypothetical protein